VTIWDDLVPHAGDLASWAEAREHWTPEDVAGELHLRRLVNTEDELDSYRRHVADEIAAAGDLETFTKQATAPMHIVSGRIALARLQDAVDALERLTYPTFARAIAKLEAREADRQDSAGREERARDAEAEALRWADAGAQD
jgi:hypothetical protein